MIDVIIPTKGISSVFEECLDSLEYINFDYNLHLINEGNNWPEAVNIGINKSKNNVVIMDDDVVLLENTFDNINFEISDIVGFTLLNKNKTVQHSGCYIDRLGQVRANKNRIKSPKSVVHCGTYLIYIKRRVFDSIGLMTELPGYQFEDVDFSFRALKKGFQPVCLPNEAFHIKSDTKLKNENFHKLVEINRKILNNKWSSDKELIRILNERGFLPQIQWPENINFFGKAREVG